MDRGKTEGDESIEIHFVRSWPENDIVALYRAKDFADAKAITSRILSHQGAGHSVGLHSTLDARALELGREVPTCRVIVNQAHCFATGGAFNNGLPFSLSMGCGSWGGNSIDGKPCSALGNVVESGQHFN